MERKKKYEKRYFQFIKKIKHINSQLYAYIIRDLLIAILTAEKIYIYIIPVAF